MSVVLTIRDQSTSPDAGDYVFELEVPSESMTVRELIRERVYQEVDDHNRRARASATDAAATRFRGLVQPEARERALNGPVKSRVRQVDWRRQFELAVDAFARRGIIVIVGERQVADLDEHVTLDSRTEVTFLRLVPLVGG